jgi:hypothetical protein
VNLAADGAPWRVVNDGVMGGVSSSLVDAGAGGVRFEGEVRTEFNGGFASARRAVEVASVSQTGVVVQRKQTVLKGQGIISAMP